MDSFVIDPVHIDLILSTAINGPWDFDGCRCRGWRPPHTGTLLDPLGVSRPIKSGTATAAGRTLLHECVAGVSRRHPDLPIDRLPGTAAGFDPERYRWTDLGPALSAIGCCKAIACLERQCALYPDWHRSPTRGFCEALRSLLVRAMRGYRDLPSHWTQERYERTRMEEALSDDLT